MILAHIGDVPVEEWIPLMMAGWTGAWVSIRAARERRRARRSQLG